MAVAVQGEWEGRLAVATLKAQSPRVFEFAGDGTLLSELTVPELDGHYGRLRTPVMGPGGALYVSTSNGGGGDRILRIVPGGSPISVTPPPVHAAPPSGGGASRRPEPSAADFAWNVTHDIKGLDTASGAATGLWGDGDTLWIAQNGNGANDALFAYDLESRERAEGREFALAETNHAPKGVWSDGVTMWISDSGQNRLFAHKLDGGARLDDRDIKLAGENGDARGIWSDDTTMWVLDDHARALFSTTSRAARPSSGTTSTPPTTILTVCGPTAWRSGFPTMTRSGSSPTASGQEQTASSSSCATATRSSPIRCSRGPATTAPAASGPTAP